MSERPNDPRNADELEPEPGDDAEATEAEPGEFEDDEPTIEEGDAALQAAADEAPLASLAAIGGVEEAERQTRPMRPSERRAMRAAMEHGQAVGESAHRVSDRASAIFVLVTVAAFAVILLYALLLGHGGFLTQRATPSPVPIASAAPSGSPAASPTSVVTVAPSAAPTDTPAVTAPPPSATPGPS